MCDAPAGCGYCRQGSIVVGYDADLVLVDLNLTQTIRNEEQITKSGWSPWHGCDSRMASTHMGHDVRYIIG